MDATFHSKTMSEASESPRMRTSSLGERNKFTMDWLQDACVTLQTATREARAGTERRAPTELEGNFISKQGLKRLVVTCQPSSTEQEFLWGIKSAIMICSLFQYHCWHQLPMAAVFYDEMFLESDSKTSIEFMRLFLNKCKSHMRKCSGVVFQELLEMLSESYCQCVWTTLFALIRLAEPSTLLEVCSSLVMMIESRAKTLETLVQTPKWNVVFCELLRLHTDSSIDAVVHLNLAESRWSVRLMPEEKGKLLSILLQVHSSALVYEIINNPSPEAVDGILRTPMKHFLSNEGWNRETMLLTRMLAYSTTSMLRNSAASEFPRRGVLAPCWTNMFALGKLIEEIAFFHSPSEFNSFGIHIGSSGQVQDLYSFIRYADMLSSFEPEFLDPNTQPGLEKPERQRMLELADRIAEERFLAEAYAHCCGRVGFRNEFSRLGALIAKRASILQKEESCPPAARTLNKKAIFELLSLEQRRAAMIQSPQKLHEFHVLLPKASSRKLVSHVVDVECVSTETLDPFFKRSRSLSPIRSRSPEKQTRRIKFSSLPMLMNAFEPGVLLRKILIRDPSKPLHSNVLNDLTIASITHLYLCDAKHHKFLTQSSDHKELYKLVAQLQDNIREFFFVSLESRGMFVEICSKSHEEIKVIKPLLCTKGMSMDSS